LFLIWCVAKERESRGANGAAIIGSGAGPVWYFDWHTPPQLEIESRRHYSVKISTLSTIGSGIYEATFCLARELMHARSRKIQLYIDRVPPRNIPNVLTSKSGTFDKINFEASKQVSAWK